MKATVDRAALDAALGVVGAVVPSRTPQPVLQSVRVQAVADGVVLTATDRSIGVQQTVSQAEVTDSGEVLLPSAKLAMIVRTSSDDTLAFESSEDRCHIRGSDSHFEVYCQDPAEFPPVATLEGDGDLEITAAALREVIARTVYAAAKENTRYAINGLLWEKQAKELKLVGTDGRRLAVAVATVEKSVGEGMRAILPVRTMRVAERLLGEADQPVSVRVTENQFLMRVGGAHLSSVLVEGNFPRYEDVVPADCDIKVAIAPEELSSAVRRAALLTNEDSKGIRLAFTEGELVLSSRAPEQGEATVRMPITYTSQAMEIGFNPTYLLDALAVVGTDEVSLDLKDSGRPGVLRAGRGFLYVIMPVSLS